MEGFTFCTHYPSEDIKLIRDDFKLEERQFLDGIREEIVSGAGLSRLLEHRSKADLIFITAFRTGDDPNAGGYAQYSDGDVDSLGNVHREGESVSKKENRRQNRNLADAIHRLGYGFVRVEGNYGGKGEESYCVINNKEDTHNFIRDMSELANLFGQDSILVAPKGHPAYLLDFNGGKTVIGDNIKVIGDVLEGYTKIKGQKFTFSTIGGMFLGRDSLHPIRSGKELLVPINCRANLLNERNLRFLIGIMPGSKL